jgi:hypothetical protein
MALCGWIGGWVDGPVIERVQTKNFTFFNVSAVEVKNIVDKIFDVL